MPRQHSPESDDEPLNNYKTRRSPNKSASSPSEFGGHISTSIRLPKHSSDSENEALHGYKTRSRLHRPASLPCEFCDHISTSIYTNFKHNATHIIIPIVNLTLHQCEDCLHHFTSLEELTTHAKVKNHSTSQVTPNPNYNIILQSIIQKQLIVKCHDLFSDIKLSGKKQNRVGEGQNRVGGSQNRVGESQNRVGESQNRVGGSQNRVGESQNRVGESQNGVGESQNRVGESENKVDVANENNPENDSADSNTKICNNVTVKTELPTYVISDSDSSGRITPMSEGNSIKKEQRQTKLEVFKTKPESISNNLQTLKPETETENVPDGNTEPNSILHTEGRSASPHRKWQHSSDSDSYSDIDTNLIDSKMKFYHSDEEITEVDKTVFKYSTLDHSSPKRRSSSDYEPIRSRLVFEDDLDEHFTEAILPDLPCRVPNSSLVTANMNKPNSIILGSQTNEVTVKKAFFGSGDTTSMSNWRLVDNRVEDIVEEAFPESVSYEALVRTEICDCRFCGRCFCNRMQLISHETTHLRIRKPRPTLCVYCERFYPGNYRALRRHVEERHPDVDPQEKRPLTHTCKICNLGYYNLSRHLKLYHKQREEEPSKTKFRKHPRYRTVKICDMCLNWRKNDDLYKYIGTQSEIGLTQKCDKCHNMHFCINLVSKFVYQKRYAQDRIVTNEERLMRIKKKLKMIKQINKCFCSCFICRVDAPR